jgi:hypothetical protein
MLAAGAPLWAQSVEHSYLHRFHALFLVGETHTGEMNGVTYGGDLELRLNRPIGVALTGEHVNEPFRENVWVFPVIVHPTPHLKLALGPGIERIEHHIGHVEQHGLLRLGASYDFPLRHGWTIDPDIAFDFVDGERLVVYTVAIGKEFGPLLGRRTAARQ